MKVTETTNNYKLSLDRRLQKAGKENELSQNKQKQRVKENQSYDHWVEVAEGDCGNSL